MTDNSQSSETKLEEKIKQLQIENSLLTGGYFQLKKITSELQESKEKFSKAFDTSPYAITITRVKDNKIISVNDAFTSISGFTKEEAISNSAVNLNLWSNIKDREKIITSLKKGLEIKDQEFQFRKKNGEYIIGLFSAKLISINNEPCIISSISDITEKKKLELLILEKQNMLEKAEMIAHLGSYALDVKQSRWTSSKELDNIFGIDKNYVHSTIGWSKLITSQDRKMMDDYFAKEVLGKHQSFNKEYRIIRQTDKALRWVHGMGQLDFDDSGQVIKMMGTIQDVTERKLLDEEVAKKNRALKMISESNQTLIHSTNEKELLDNICQIIVKDGGYLFAWVGLVEFDKNKTIYPIAQAGFDKGYLKNLKITWADTKYGSGPNGQAARSGQPIIAKNIAKDPIMAPWRTEALKRGYQSSMTLPLSIDNKIFGVLTIYSGKIDAFNKDDLKIFSEFTGDLSFGIKALRTRAENTRIQEALVISEAKYRSLFETAKDGIIILDAQTGEVKEVNYYLIELLGYGPNEFLRRKLWEIDLFKVIVNSQEAFEKLKNQKYSRFENIQLKTKGDKLIYVEFDSNIYPINRSGVIQFSIRNVTEHHNLEEQIVQSEKRYSTLVENINDVVVLIQDGIIKYINPAVENIINLSPAQMIGQPMINFVAPEFRQLVGDNYKNRLQGQKTETRYEFSIINEQGKAIPVETNSSTVMFEGRPADISIIRDVSRAKQIDTIKSEFISVASHQLRSPLTGIKWFSQLLINQKIGRLSKKQIDFIQQIYNSNERMIRLVNDLLDVSHIETGHKFKIEKASANIVSLINNVIKDQKINFPTKKITIDLDKNCPDKLIFDFDENKIYQVFSNLISNSIKYSGETTKIIISLNCPGNEIQLSVQDFGLGIPAHQKNRIFQKFFRADNIATVSTDGTGLGLYIAKGIVEAHGGKIWFDSEQDKGTTFYFTLPFKNKKEGKKDCLI